MRRVAKSLIRCENANARRAETRAGIGLNHIGAARTATERQLLSVHRKLQPPGQGGALPMSRNDESRTPSGWHQDASQRDAGHDEMQAAHWRDLQARMADGWTIRRHIWSRERDLALVAVGIEYPFTIRGRVAGFADIAARFEAPKPKEYYGDFNITWFSFVEVKPRIYSVGAVLRQCEATEVLARGGGYENFDVFALVYDDDPKLHLLTEVSRFPVIQVARP